MLNIFLFLIYILTEKELKRWKSNLDEIICNFGDICWTTCFTIDRVKSQCISKNFNFDNYQLCDCCLSQYVDTYRSNFSAHDIKRIKNLFGKYIDHAILYWYWYGRYNRSFLNHIWKYYRHYQLGKPIENIFQLAVSLHFMRNHLEK